MSRSLILVGVYSLFLFFILCIQAFSSEDLDKKKQFRFKSIINKQIDSMGPQRDIVQDEQGFMWFGGENGLARFDGHTVKSFKHNPDDPNSLSANLVYELLIDRQGSLWVATINGLNRYDAESDVFVKYFNNPHNPDSLGNNNVRSILEYSDGSLWFGTSNGLSRMDINTGIFTHIVQPVDGKDSQGGNDVWALVEDEQGAIWIGSRRGGGGLDQYNPKTNTFIHYRHNPNDPDSLSHDSAQAVYLDHQGELWVGTQGGGLNRLNRETGKFVRYQYDQDDPFSLSSNIIQDIFEDRHNNLWVATDGGGLSRFVRSSNHFDRYEHHSGNPDSLRSDKVRTFFEDSSGDLWFGHFPFGISMLDLYASSFHNFRHNPSDSKSLSNSAILAIEEDTERYLWVGTEQGLNHLDLQSREVRHYLHDPKDVLSLGANPALSILQNHQGVWVGTWSGGLSLLDPATGKFKTYRSDPDDNRSISGNNIWSIYQDTRGDLWIGTETAGLNRYNPETDNFTHYRTSFEHDGNRGSNWINTIYEDSQHNFWIGTDNGLGLMDRETGNIKYFLHNKEDPMSISANRITAIEEDKANNLWVATHGGGVNKLDSKTGTFTSYLIKHGLADNVVSGILEDEQGYLWFSTGNGLSQFDPANETFRNYDEGFGLPSVVFNRPAYLKTSNNKLLFGSTHGLTMFDPQSMEVNKEVPRIVITGFEILNEPVVIGALDSPLHKAINFTDKLTLTHNHSLFSFQFNVLNYLMPEKNQYAYMLEGFDKNWNYIGNRRTAFYTNLDPGNYVFRVKGSNNERVWNETGKAIQINVLAPLWQTWWAYSLYMLIITAIFVLIGYLEYKKRQEKYHNHQATLKREEQLHLALWGSGDEFWDVNLKDSSVVRQNRLDYLDKVDINYWQLSDVNKAYIHPDDQLLIEQKINQYFTGNKDFFEVAYRAKAKKGGWLWLLDRGQVTARDINGEPLRFIGTTKNIQRLKQTEVQLLTLNQELEQRVELRTSELKESHEYLKSTQSKLVESEKMASLGTLVIGVSHELNTPVGIAVTALSNLKSRLDELFEKVAAGKLSKSTFNCFRENASMSIDLGLSNMAKTASIVKSFKEISMVQGTYKFKTEMLRTLLEKSIAATLLLDNVNINDVVIKCPSALGITTYTEILLDVISQLIKNVQNYAFLPGEAVKINISVSEEKDGIVIVFADEGKGMVQEVKDHIFDPFYTTNRGSSTGLGMHVVYNQVCHLLKGSITCISEPEKGTRFTIHLPHKHQD